MIHSVLFLTFLGVLNFQGAVGSTPGGGSSQSAGYRGTLPARDHGGGSSEVPRTVAAESSGRAAERAKKKLIIHMKHGLWVEGKLHSTDRIPNWVQNPVDPRRPPFDQYYAYMNSGPLGTFYTESNATSNDNVLDSSAYVPIKVALQIDAGNNRDTFVSNVISELEHRDLTQIPYLSPIGYIFAHVFVAAKQRREVYLFKLSVSQSLMKRKNEEKQGDKKRRRLDVPANN